MRRTAALPLRRASIAWRSMFLGAAWLWAGGLIAFLLAYHFAQPSSPFLVAGGHTYYTHPPALTLNQQDPVSTKILTIALGLTLLVGTVDLVIRTARRMTGPGVAALLAGGMLMVFSLFGLLWGLAEIGTAGLLVIFSGLAMKTSGSGSADKADSVESPPAWYPDPTERHDLRYWDGVVWSSHVATAGRVSTDLV
jgi:Protein of unknown function (DUF2510)